MTMTTTPENLTTKEIKISMRNETNVESEMEWSEEKERERGQQKKKEKNDENIYCKHMSKV